MTDDDRGEYEILGHRVKFRPKASDQVDPSHIVGVVLDEITKIKSRSNVQTSEAMLLAALNLARDKIALEKNVEERMAELRTSASDALELVEEVHPS